MKTNTEDSAIRWGIIGVGDVCEVKSAPAMQRIEHSALVAVMRRNADKAADYARRHGVPRWYSDVDDLLNDDEVNAIYIATPPSTHALYTKLAAEKGYPVYVEKPMALSTKECREMIAVCDRYEVPLFVAYYRRTLPNFLKIKELVDQDAIGEVRSVQISLIKTAAPDLVSSDTNWRVDPDIAGGGYFYDLGSHQFDFLDYLFGPISQVSGHIQNQAGLYPAEDIVSASFEFDNGVIGSGLWCFTGHESAQEEITTIVGSKGRIQFATFGDPQVILENDDGKQVFQFELPKHIQQPLIQRIVDELRGEGQCPSHGQSAARTNKVLEQIITPS